MAATIAKADLIDEGTLVGDQMGWHVTRKWIVTGLTNTNGYDRQYDATQVRGIPRYGQSHPNRTLGIVVARINVGSISTTGVPITVDYEPIGIAGLTEVNVSESIVPGTPGGGQISIRGGMQTVTTSRDGEGNVIILTDCRFRRTADSEVKATCEDGAESPEPVYRKGDLIEQGALVQRTVPTDSITFKRREPKHPRAKQVAYRGAVDPSALFGDPPAAWMCTRLDGNSNDGGKSYNVTYEFQRSVDRAIPKLDGKLVNGVVIGELVRNGMVGGWSAVVIMTDPETGQPIANPEINAGASPGKTDGRYGIRRIRYAFTANFIELNLEF